MMDKNALLSALGTREAIGRTRCNEPSSAEGDGGIPHAFTSS